MSDTLSYPSRSGGINGGNTPVEALLEVRNLTKRFNAGNMGHKNQVLALNDVSFGIGQGQVVSLVGESGSGKSTTARLIARLMPPSEGEILLHGRNVLKTEKRKASLQYRREVQMIFQDPFGSLNPVHTIGYHLSRPLQIHHQSKNKPETLDKVHELLGIVGLNPPHVMAKKYPHQLSGGQRQRLSIARALAVNPKIVLADEPISMLDVSIRMGILNLLEKLKEERSIGFLYITHDIASARYIGDKTMVMYAGHIVEEARSEVLMDNPLHPYTRLLLSAVPNPQAGLANRKVQANGEIPSLSDIPPGCPFAPRCPKALGICHQVKPVRVEVETEHRVLCHLFGEPQP